MSEPKSNARPVLFVTRLVELREAKGLTQLQAAAGAGLTGVDSLKDAEAGHGIRLDTAIKLARFFGLPVEMIWMPSPPEEVSP